MNILNKIMTLSPCYKANKIIITPKGAMLHSVGCAQPNAQAFINAENKSTAKAGVHAFIDASNNVYQTLPIFPDSKTCVRNWHGGSGPKGNSNNTHIGIEMTEPSSIKYTGGATFVDLNPESTKAFVLSTYKTAVEYFAYLCKVFDWNPLEPGVILSHAEGHAKGISTDHHDVEHIWSKFGLTMDQFRTDVNNLKNATISTVTVSTNPTTVVNNPTPVVNPVVNVTSSVNYTIEVNTSELNIRSKALATSDLVGVVKKGEVYTIISESDGWGLLKSGKGWIRLSYTKPYTDSVTQSPAPVTPVDNSYKVKITADSLRVRAIASAKGVVIAGVKKGEVYTITDTKDGWGKMSLGWISLEYTKKI